MATSGAVNDGVLLGCSGDKGETWRNTIESTIYDAAEEVSESIYRAGEQSLQIFNYRNCSINQYIEY